MRDEYVLKNGKASVIRRVNKDGTTKTTEEIEGLGEFIIKLNEGTNTITIKNYTANLSAKFAIKSYIPILGSYLSDGVSVILAGSVLIKNAVGVSGLLLLFSVVFSPLIKIIIVLLLLKLTSAILEPLGDSKVSNFLFSISKSLNMLVVCLLATSFMYLISVSLLMSCSNVF